MSGGQGVAVQAPSAEISGELSRPHLARPMSSAARGSLIAMASYNLVIALPTADRSSAYAFAQALGLETPGEVAEDGVPEPLRVQLNEQASVMYVPTVGFGWITDGRATTEPGISECLLSLQVGTTTRSTAWSGASMRPAVGWCQVPSRRPGATPERSPTLTVTCGKPSSRRSDPAVGSGEGALRRHLCASARL